MQPYASTLKKHRDLPCPCHKGFQRKCSWWCCPIFKGIDFSQDFWFLGFMEKSGSGQPGYNLVWESRSGLSHWGLREGVVQGAKTITDCQTSLHSYFLRRAPGYFPAMLLVQQQAAKDRGLMTSHCHCPCFTPALWSRLSPCLLHPQAFPYQQLSRSQ